MIQTLEVISLNLWQVIISLIDLLIIFLLSILTGIGRRYDEKKPVA